MKNALEACKIRLQWHLRRFKKIIGIYDKIFYIQFDDKEIIVELSDNSASKDLVSRLPLDVQFEDFNSTEKISYLDKNLDTSDAPTSCLPVRGTLA